MTGVSHATTGVVIALAIHNPVLAFPLAFASHFMLDALPHYGDDTLDGTDKFFRRFIIVDAILGFGVTILMMFLIPEKAVAIAFCGALAAVPDLMWLPNHVRQVKNLETKPNNRLMHWHQRIQFEHPVWGIAAEAVWFVAMAAFLVVILV